MPRCLIFPSSGKDDGHKYNVSFASNDKPNAMSKPMPLDEFCMAVSSADRFEIIEDRRKGLEKATMSVNKRDKKINEKEAQAAKKAQDRVLKTEAFQWVELRFKGVQVAAWVPQG